MWALTPSELYSYYLFYSHNPTYPILTVSDLPMPTCGGRSGSKSHLSAPPQRPTPQDAPCYTCDQRTAPSPLSPVETCWRDPAPSGMCHPLACVLCMYTCTYLNDNAPKRLDISVWRSPQGLPRCHPIGNHLQDPGGAPQGKGAGQQGGGQGGQRRPVSAGCRQQGQVLLQAKEEAQGTAEARSAAKKGLPPLETRGGSGEVTSCVGLFTRLQLYQIVLFFFIT